MKRVWIVLYGLICYLIFFGVFLYSIGFLSNTLVPKSIDSGVPLPTAQALLINLGLVALFGLQHSVMSRRRFKQWWTQWVPSTAERSTYVLAASLMLALIMWQWQPLVGVIWHVDGAVGRTIWWAIFWLGQGVVLLSTFLINHFELFGLQQVYSQARRQPAEEPTFQTPLLYKLVRHPMQLGIVISYWATPDMTVGHLLFAASMTVYILIGLYFEERDLVRRFGKEYLAYRRVTPKLLPNLLPGGLWGSNVIQRTASDR